MIAFIKTIFTALALVGIHAAGTGASVMQALGPMAMPDDKVGC